MPKATVPISATALPKSRRAALAMLGVASALVAIPAAAKAASARAPDADDIVIALWERAHALRQPIREARRVLNEAEARMPQTPAVENVTYFNEARRADHIAYREEQERLSGYTAADAALDALHSPLGNILNAIEELPPTTPNVAAALIMIQIYDSTKPGKPISHGPHGSTLIALQYLRPSLRGIVLEHVAELLDNQTRIWGDCQAAFDVC